MTRVTIYPLDASEPAMFARSFCRKQDADDYENFWRRLGCCRIERN